MPPVPKYPVRFGVWVPPKKSTPKPRVQKGLEHKGARNVNEFSTFEQLEHRIQVPLVRAFHDPVRNRWERLPEVGFHGWLVAEGPRS